MPHPVTGSYANCLACHASGGDLNMPANHNGFSVGNCLDCHAAPGPDGAAPAPIPHPTTDAYAFCVTCHAIGNSLGMPADHAKFTNETCTRCHAGPETGDAGKGS